MDSKSTFETKLLPTNYKPQRKPSFISDILNNTNYRTALTDHKKQDNLKRYDTEKYRNPFQKQLCVNMLSKGFHKSFAEVLDLIQLQFDIRQELGNEHPVWDKPLIIQEITKFEVLCSKLNTAENSKREGNLKIVYQSYYDLAIYFLANDEQWLTDYFFNKCLTIVAGGVSSWEIRKEAESHCNLGLSFEKQTNDFTAKSDRIRDLYYRSMYHFERYHNLTNNQNWIDDDYDKIETLNKYAIERELEKYRIDTTLIEKTLFTHACIHLQRIYKIISQKYCLNSAEKIKYLIKALEVCREGGVKILEGQVSYMLGEAYKESEEFDMALVCFNNFYEISKKLKDIEAYGKSSEALANCYKKMGNLTKSIEYLKKYLNEENHECTTIQHSKICSALANIYNALGQYETATEYSKKAFEISKQNNERNESEFNRIIYATAKAHKQLEHYTFKIETNDKDALNELIIKKSNFSDLIQLQPD